jgi:hypothetical protein
MLRDHGVKIRVSYVPSESHEIAFDDGQIYRDVTRRASVARIISSGNSTLIKSVWLRGHRVIKLLSKQWST